MGKGLLCCLNERKKDLISQGMMAKKNLRDFQKGMMKYQKMDLEKMKN